MTSQKLSTASTTVAAEKSIASTTVPSPQYETQSSYFMRHNVGLKTIATTPPPSTTTTEPTPDPYSHERSIFQGRISDVNLNMLKEQIRIMNGLPRTIEKEMKRRKRLPCAPIVRPRPTVTSRRRTELMQRRLIVRCGNLKEKFDEYDRMVKSANMDELYRQLRDASFKNNSEEMAAQFEHQELENLKYLADRARENEEASFRDNQGSKLRFKFIRGEPIISSAFRTSYDDFMKPPFVVTPGIWQPKPYNMPKLNKEKEIWLTPLDDDLEGIPLHLQLKTPDPKDKRSLKERARPSVKQGKRTSFDEWAKRKEGEPKRPPWTNSVPCPPNTGWFN